MKSNPVLTKKDFVRRYAKGEFGNASPTWLNVSHFLRDNRTEGFYLRGDSDRHPNYVERLFHIRNRVKGGPTWYNVKARNVTVVWEQCLREGCDRKDLYISEMAPTERTTLQGELMYTDIGLQLYGTKVKKPMRDALKEHAFTLPPITALAAMRMYMDPISVDWIHILFERFPDHVVEFSVYNKSWGTVPHVNTVIWEVRKYILLIALLFSG